ncbi:hypothetical protein LTR28_007852 [Elasticomyces elasticus]|nr:hypothetical protein LTR28_007852 [Elasticomyces elasticus]
MPPKHLKKATMGLGRVRSAGPLHRIDEIEAAFQQTTDSDLINARTTIHETVSIDCGNSESLSSRSAELNEFETYAQRKVHELLANNSPCSSEVERMTRSIVEEEAAQSTRGEMYRPDRSDIYDVEGHQYALDMRATPRWNQPKAWRERGDSEYLRALKTARKDARKHAREKKRSGTEVIESPSKKQATDWEDVTMRDASGDHTCSIFRQDPDVVRMCQACHELFPPLALTRSQESFKQQQAERRKQYESRLTEEARQERLDALEDDWQAKLADWADRKEDATPSEMEKIRREEEVETAQMHLLRYQPDPKRLSPDTYQKNHEAWLAYNYPDHSAAMSDPAQILDEPTPEDMSPGSYRTAHLAWLGQEHWHHAEAMRAAAREEPADELMNDACEPAQAESTGKQGTALDDWGAPPTEPKTEPMNDAYEPAQAELTGKQGTAWDDWGAAPTEPIIEPTAGVQMDAGNGPGGQMEVTATSGSGSAPTNIYTLEGNRGPVDTNEVQDW